jgi:hypothetical protein
MTYFFGAMWAALALGGAVVVLVYVTRARNAK